MKSKIDINVDLGEGFNNESSIMPFISSVNIACGGHAGSNELMGECVELAIENNVRIGAHPAFEDKANFGREKLDIPLNELKQSISKQIEHLNRICESKGAVLSYVKPHGALYHLICNEFDYAQMVLDLMKSDFSSIAIMGMPNSLLEKQANLQGVSFIKEGFADRVYEENGQLRDRKKEGAVWEGFDDVLNQVLSFARGGLNGVEVDSICFHGDHEGSAELIQKINADLKSRKIEVGV